ncbi:4Fe-4S dicluster domain-containing protein [Telmatospirillum siberiense]|uniref:Effector protein n=1 Tax=Telmatospirillum siberiense TaxID=382514 RepID=A0A2N3PPN7_9PROT|nr:4Fe-4S dicluster domain-containing protein [Telmatospirillum siberiense]PKU22373.1 effector protein [Telmatospirillum siberiense]
MNRFVFADPMKCIGCHTCEIACVVAHAGGASGETPWAQDFMPRLRVVKSDRVSAPILCHHCEDAPCARVCPNGAIVYRNSSVQVIQDRCIGCKTCMLACPFGAMSVVTVAAQESSSGRRIKTEARKCDLCDGREEGPACVSVCPTKALDVIDQAMMDASLRKRRISSVTTVLV